MSTKSALSLSRTSIRRCSSLWAPTLASKGGPANMRINPSWPLVTARADSFHSGRISSSVSPMTCGHAGLSPVSRRESSVTACTASRTSSTRSFSSPCRLLKSYISIHSGARRCSLMSWICLSTGSWELIYSSRLEHWDGSSDKAWVMAFVWASKAFCLAACSNCMCVSGWKFPHKNRRWLGRGSRKEWKNSESRHSGKFCRHSVMTWIMLSMNGLADIAPSMASASCDTRMPSSTAADNIVLRVRTMLQTACLICFKEQLKRVARM
mmetsp:Transcript_87704/g.237781  ORF Transcript_87704/g.237781 Transcript_87704/m.237781 type:complete len:267 (-) Transcript_87704:80-880(-)